MTVEAVVPGEAVGDDAHRFREAVVRKHTSSLPILFYIFSFAKPMPSLFASPRAFFGHPYMVFAMGVLCALVSGAGISTIDLIYGNWTQNLRVHQYTDPGEAERYANLLGWVCVLIGVFVFVTSWAFMVCMAKVAHELTHLLRQEYFAAVVIQDPSFFEQHGPGEIASLANRDVAHIRAAMGEKLGFFLNACGTLITSFIMAFVRAPTVAAVMFCVFVFAAISTSMLGWIGDKVNSSAMNLDNRLSTYVEQVIASVRLVHSFEIAQTLVERMQVLYIAPMARYVLRRSTVKGGDLAVMYLVINALYSISFWWGSIQIARGNESMEGVISGFYNYLSSMFCMAMIIPHLQSIADSTTMLRRMRATIERDPAVDVRQTGGLILATDTEGANGPVPYEASFALDHVTFAYPSRPYTASLRDVSVTFPAGKVTALVGPSGSGKSTITALLGREYDPGTSNFLKEKGEISEKTLERTVTSASQDLEATALVKGEGRILFADVDVRALNLRWLRSRVAVVRQNPQLFSGTIAENVAMGLSAIRPNVSVEDTEVREMVHTALVKAEAWQFVKRLPDGMDTYLSGGRNVHLSGGQRQRLAIARALVRKPQILCLDEATSALDTSTEERIKRTLQKEQKERGMTTIIVAHRLSTIQHADQIVTMNRGQVAECGTHEELMRIQNGIYHGMVMHNRSASGLPVEDQPFEEGETATRASSTVWQPTPVPTTKRPKRSDSVTLPRAYEKPIMHSEVTTRGAGVTGASWSALDRRYDTATVHEEEAEEQVPESTPRARFPLYHLARDQRWLFLIGILGTICLAATMPITGWISGYSIDTLGILNDPGRLRSESNKWAMWFIIVGVIAVTTGFVGSFSLEYASEEMTNSIKVSTMQALMRQEVAFFDLKENSSGALSSSLFSHAASIGAATGVVAVQLIMALGNLIGSLIMALKMGWKLALTTFPGLVTLAISAYFNIRFMERYERIVQEPIDDTSAYIAEIIDAMPTVASLGRENLVVRQMAEESRLRRSFMPALMLGGLCFAYSQFALYGTLGLMMHWGTHLVMTRRLESFAMFAVFEGVFIGVYSSVRLSTFMPDLARAKHALKVIDGWLHRVPRVAKVAESNAAWPPAGPRDIVFTDIELRYPQRPETAVLRDVNLTIHENMHVAFCGTSGSGKTSVLSLLQRFYEPCKGSIVYGGIDLRSVPLPLWHAEMAYVTQDPVLYEGTLRWNLLLGAREGAKVSEAEIEEACRAACVWDFAMALPEGLETMIGLKGSSLSGGQRQRVCIARALLRKPKILLLDEATSALDAESEVLVQQALDNAMVGCTTISIAHRLSTIRRADMICVVEEGQIVETGTHEQLLQKHGRYFELVEAQL